MREPGLPAGHHVAVIAENGERVRGNGAGGHVNDRRRELARDLVHVGDHQQQALRSGEGGAQRARLDGAVQRSGRAGFALQLHHRGHHAPDVGLTLGRPLVGEFSHVGRRRDRDRSQSLRWCGKRQYAAASLPSIVTIGLFMSAGLP